MARTLYLVRHGLVEEKYQGTLVGATDALLCDTGLEQASRLERFFTKKSIDLCLCSPMTRCVQTAEKAVGPLGLEIKKDEIFREVDFGDWETLTFSDVYKKDPDGVSKWISCDPDLQFPGGDSLGDFIARVENAAGVLRDIPEESVAVFTHGGVIRFMLCHLLGLEYRKHSVFEVRYTDVFVLKIFDRGSVLSAIVNSEDV